jgi:C4-type Zn-finger protein
MLAKIVKPATACREANYSRDTIDIREDSRSRDNRHIMNVNSRRTARIRQYESQQHSVEMPATAAELTTLTLATVWWTAAETILASQMSTAKGIPLTAGMPTTLETPTIVLAV